MCDFFSCVTKGDGKMYYFDWELRKKIIAKEIDFEPDSHASIAKYFKLDEDICNKYEYNPLTEIFTIDQINNPTNDKDAVYEQLKKMDWKKVVEPLIVKRIVHPFRDIEPKKVTNKDKMLLKEWASVRDSVGDSVWASVRDSVRDSVWDSVWASVGDSVWAYYSSFFHIEYKFNFSVCVKLWERGFVPSFDGKTWRLHSGKNAEIVFEITAEELKKLK